ncbi:MAG TPA: LTA synthase family protein, partial [Pirellulales bacterium]|nr:LTA synthase family protein [Pirellulales bacterium]
QRREIASDLLTPVETTIPIREKLAIIQAESLDFNVLGLEIGGQEVTPFLNRLRERSLFYRIAAARDTGSADADFIMLAGVMPSPHINTYNIRSYPYRNTLPQFLKQFGYNTALFHGNTGNFYSRRGAFEKMGFSEVHFLEEMLADSVPPCPWGIEDRQVLEYSSQLLREASGPTCHFVITMSTHTPYRLLRSVESEVVPHPKTMADDYFNNMRYLDSRFRDYIGSLGAATVVIYSDHPADAELSPEFVPDCESQRGHVPCWIFDTEADLGALQRTRDQRMATDGGLTLLDVSSFLRGHIAAGNGPSPLPVLDRGGCELASDR